MRCHHRLGVVLTLAGALARPAADLAATAADRVYVAVADSRGRPVAGLTAADFTVEIDGQPQEIQSAVPATDPVSIVIITDRLGLEPAYNIVTVSRALTGFVKGVHSALPDSLFALTTFDGPVVRMAGFSSPTGGLNRTLERLSTNAPQAAMLDALVDACRVLQGATTERRAIFAVYAGYRPDTSAEWNDTAALTLWQSKASLWAIEVQSTSAAGVRAVGREQVVHQGSLMSGGMSETVASAVGLETMTQRMSALIGKQYVITYGPGGGGTTASRRKVTIARKGVRVLAPTWNPR
jgi:hypothetical protein